MMAAVEQVEVVLANNDRVTLRVGDVFLKIDVDQTRTDVEVEAIAMAPVPTPEILWRKQPVLAVAALPGRALGCVQGTSPRRRRRGPRSVLPSGRCTTHRCRHGAGRAWTRSRPGWPMGATGSSRMRYFPLTWSRATGGWQRTALRPWTPAFIHGDLHDEHVFVDGDEVSGIIDWSEAAQGDALYDLASLTLQHPERLGDVVAGYGTDVDRDLIRAWWSLRSLSNVRWLVENGYGSPEDYPEVAVLRRA